MSPLHKNPACTEQVLKFLYVVRDALLRTAFIEARKYLEDALALIQNELEWCYHTDAHLPAMRDYALQCIDVLEYLRYSITSERTKQVQLLCENLEQTIIAVGNAVRLDVTMEAPGRVDALEREHRFTV